MPPEVPVRDGRGRGKPVKLFDPDAASAQMKLWMYDDCLKYIQEKRGQMPLALVGRVG